MSHLFDLLDSVIMVTMGTCGFISVGLLIFRPDLGTSIPLFKLPMGNWLRSLCLFWYLAWGGRWLVEYRGPYNSLCQSWDFSQEEWSFVLILLVDYRCKWVNMWCYRFNCFALVFSIFRSRFVQLYFSRLVQLFFSQLYSYFPHLFKKGSYNLPDDLPDDLPLSHFISSAGL